MHTPVLLKEVLEVLGPVPGDLVVDGTINGGGHAREIMKRISPKGTLVGVEWDEELFQKTKKDFAGKSALLVNDNYANLPEILKRLRLAKADKLLLDLGFSSFHVDEAGRGFSFGKDEPLRMTYNTGSSSATQILKELSEEDLADVIFEYGGERFSRRIAKAIKQYVKEKKLIRTSAELRSIVVSAVPRAYERGRIDPATRTFQAIRIFANRELENLKSILAHLPEVMAPGGIAAVISFHSLEDKIVKEAFKGFEKQHLATLLFKKPIVPGRDEMRDNPRSRSAKLRAIKFR